MSKLRSLIRRLSNKPGRSGREDEKEYPLINKHFSETTVYRAGTETGPSFEVENEDKVWLITDPALYYLLDENEKVMLWKSVIPEESVIIEEKQSRYKGITVVKLKLHEKGFKKLQKELLSLPWVTSKVSSDEGGMSAIASKPLVQAIFDYMYYNYPTTAEEFNFQAELKAVSHWRWWKKGEVPQFESGLHDDKRIIKAASMALQKWKELEEEEFEKVSSSTATNAQQTECEQSDSPSENESISDLREDIFCLTKYYGKYLLTESDDKETSRKYQNAGQQSFSTDQEKNTQEREIPRKKQSRGGKKFQTTSRRPTDIRSVLVKY